MSPRKLTEDDKQEILEQYRNSEATTSTLAKSYEVSSSTISRFLKNKLSTEEYEDLIQQKRLARTPRGEKSPPKEKKTSKKRITKKASSKTSSQPKVKRVKAKRVKAKQEPEGEEIQLTIEEIEPKPSTKRRRRRRSAASEVMAEAIISELISEPDIEEETTVEETIVEETTVEEATPTKLILDKKVRNNADDKDIPKSDRLILKTDRNEPEEEDDDDELEMITLKEMLGEDLEDINDDDDDDNWEEEEDDSAYTTQYSDISDVEILPLSQAALLGTCYLVIDRAAELIVKPLAEFADLGVIPEAEVKERTLPVFDNHRIAKRFSHRRERVIKVPDGRMLQKTSQHLQEKGITRLLINGQIYTL